MTVHHGNKGGPEGTTPFAVSSQHTGTASGAGDPGALQQHYNTNDVGCACRNEDPSLSTLGKYQIAPSLGMVSDGNGGSFADFPAGMEFGWKVPGLPFELPTPSEYIDEVKRLVEGTKKDPFFVPKQCAEGMVEVAKKTWKWGKEVFDNPQEAYKAAVKELGERWDNLTAEDLLDALQLGLDVAGMIPGLGVGADAINGAISLGREDYLGAIVSAIAAIPAVGDAIAAVLKPLLQLLKKGGIALKAVLTKIDDLFIAAVNKLPCDGVGGAVKQELGEWMKSLKEAVEKWCFPAGTKVRSEDGEKNIEDIRSGDVVWAYDESTGKWVLAEVRKLFKRLLVGTLMVLVFAWGELEVTPEHPFYVVQGQALNARDIAGLHTAHNGSDAGAWVKAGNLQSGDRIESQHGSQEVLAIRTRQTREWVYNFEVSGVHTYAVGTVGLVVHNTCYTEAPEAAKKKYPGKAGTIEKHHVKPKYLGGADDGPTIEIDGAYHQEITNEFRKHVPYRSKMPTPERVAEIMEEVYKKFPLPK